MAPLFSFSYRVSYADCTVGNHVYYARYLDILERARGEWFRASHCSLKDLEAEDAIFPVVEINLKYKGAARYDDALNVTLAAKDVSAVRFSVASRIQLKDGTLLVEGETRHVCTTLVSKPRRLPEKLAALFQTATPAE